MPNTLWMTGATGFVGSHFLYRILTRSDAHVVAVLRPKQGESAHARLGRTLEVVARSYRALLDVSALEERVTVVDGDITSPGCGVRLDTVDPALLAGAPVFWHMAASLSYEDRQRDHIRLHNVDGARNALALASSIGSGRFAYVSTAYTCGRVSGSVHEALHTLDRPFNNVYEQTKCEAEHEVARWSASTGTPASILRPSIVVGPRVTYAPAGSDTGLYGFAREVSRLKRMLAAAPRALSMLGDRDAPLNLVPVDDLVEGMCELASRDFAGGLVHHFTATSSPSIGTVLRVVGTLCGAGPIDVVTHRDETPSPVEQAMDRRAAFYASYLRAEKHFERRAEKRIDVDDDEVARFVGGYARQRRSETPESAFRVCTLRADDGTQLIGYAAGAPALPTVVLCNAYGLDADIWVPLAQALASEAHVLTWAMRADATGPDTHADDLRALLDQHGVTTAYVAGYCTGADVALRFAERHPERVRGVASLSGALNATGATETSFQRNMRKLARGASSDLAHATLYHQLLFGARRGYGALAEAKTAGDESMLASMVGTLDPELLHLTSAPFRDPATLHAYARTMHAHYQHSARTGLSSLPVPTLFVTGGRDEVAHPEASRMAAACMGDATLVELDAGDHFAIYNDARMASALRDFVARCEARRAGQPAAVGSVAA
ncbi:MAG: alpha/beta fold hydrolase [Polyangiales bacterium]